MKEYTSNESIPLNVGEQWKVNGVEFTCAKRDDQRGWESYIIEIKDPSYPNEVKRLRVTGRSTVMSIDLYNTYNNLKGIL